MKKILISLFILSSVIFVIAADSPYARRIAPMADHVSPCTENQIGYDMIDHNLYICKNTGWSLAGGSGPDVVNGPASSTDNAIARYDGVTGKLLQDSILRISDTAGLEPVTGSTLYIGNPLSRTMLSLDGTFSGFGDYNCNFNCTQIEVHDAVSAVNILAKTVVMGQQHMNNDTYFILQDTIRDIEGKVSLGTARFGDTDGEGNSTSLIIDDTVLEIITLAAQNGTKFLSNEGNDSIISLWADDGDDNADKWAITSLAAGGLQFSNPAENQILKLSFADRFGNDYVDFTNSGASPIYLFNGQIEATSFKSPAFGGGLYFAGGAPWFVYINTLSGNLAGFENEGFYLKNPSSGVLALTYSVGTPTISGTGTLNSDSKNSAGKVTSNTTGAASIVLTFSTAFTRAPACNVSNETTANLARATSTTTQVTIAGTTVTGDVISYSCIGY